MGKGGFGKGWNNWSYNNWSYNKWRTPQQYLGGPYGAQQSASPIGAFTNGVGQMTGDLKGLGDFCKIGTALGDVVTQASTTPEEGSEKSTDTLTRLVGIADRLMVPPSSSPAPFAGEKDSQ